jgi:hypothetical protein
MISHIILIGFFCLNMFSSIKISLLKTDIAESLPRIKLHYTALISDGNDLYIFDLIPKNRLHFKTIRNLLFFRKVPAQTRLRHFYNNSITEERLIQVFNDNIREIDDERCKRITSTTLKNIKNKTLHNFISKHINVDTIHLYTSNCQHFYKRLVDRELTIRELFHI